MSGRGRYEKKRCLASNLPFPVMKKINEYIEKEKQKGNKKEIKIDREKYDCIRSH